MDRLLHDPRWRLVVVTGTAGTMIGANASVFTRNLALTQARSLTRFGGGDRTVARDRLRLRQRRPRNHVRDRLRMLVNHGEMKALPLASNIDTHTVARTPR